MIYIRKKNNKKRRSDNQLEKQIADDNPFL
jgi:hypothetical protein